MRTILRLLACPVIDTVERGKLADLVLLDANPLQDIRNTQKIVAAIIDGRLHDRAPLDAMLAAAADSAKR